MRKLVLGNIDYRKHVTDEGDQLQMGLGENGWRLAGRGFMTWGKTQTFPMGCTDVKELLELYQPEIVFIQDVRDWHKESDSCFDPSVSFENFELLAQRQDIFKVMVYKDAASSVGYQQQMASRMGVNALATYYHVHSVNEVAFWTESIPQIRQYHSIDRALINKTNLSQERRPAVVSGALAGAYPLRQMAFDHAEELGLDKIDHPGYHNRGSNTPEYLSKLLRYKIHVATASRYGFALRKIIESVCCGCTPITNLPTYDVLPIIDDWLIRIPSTISVNQLKETIRFAVASWSQEEALEKAKLACEYYDYRENGLRLDRAIVEEFHESKSPSELLR